MGRTQKWEEIYKQTNERHLGQDENERFLVFLSIGDIKNLPTTIPRTAGSGLSNGSSSLVECWVRATLCDADGIAFHDDEMVESQAVPLNDNPSLGMIPIMVGDTHRIGVSIDSLEETVCVWMEHIYEIVSFYLFYFLVQKLSLISL